MLPEALSRRPRSNVMPHGRSHIRNCFFKHAPELFPLTEDKGECVRAIAPGTEAAAIDVAMASDALGDLSPGGRLPNTNRGQQSCIRVPAESARSLF